MELQEFMRWYNNERDHQSLNYLTPEEKAHGFMDKFTNLPTTPQLLQQAS